ncbi:MAG: HEAT repeat domain-containing protein [Fimbriiglobus sp.]
MSEKLAKGDRDEKLAAARELWKAQSRRQAANVLVFLAGSPPGGDGFRQLRREVEADLKPSSILRELKEGEYRWGAWLAFLRPHEDLVPTLLEGLKKHPEYIDATMLALGNSGDARARGPLVELLESRETTTSSFAASALGYLGDPEVEPILIQKLSKDSGFIQVQACLALAKIGTSKSLPALQKHADNNGYTGALNIQGCAKQAIEAIKKRDMHKK